jgi:alkaline phosphatase
VTQKRPSFLRHALLTLLAVAAVVAGVSQLTTYQLEAGNVVLRAQRGVFRRFPAPPGGTLEGTSAQPRAGTRKPGTDRPRSLVLVIADGMGVGPLSTASALIHGTGGGLAVERFPVVGLVRTAAADDLVTDSAAGATAMATGFKVPRKAVSMLADKRLPVTLFEAARQRGLGTGVVTTTGLVDATPAAFVAHAGKRSEYGNILRQMVMSGTDVLIGGDWSRSRGAQRDQVYTDLMLKIEEVAADRYTVVRSEQELLDADGPVLALFPPRGDSPGLHGPRLVVSTRQALQVLADNPEGFLLMVETEEIDEDAHENRIDGVVAGVEELDEAIEAVLEFADTAGDVLVLVTADHDTGGLGIVRGRYSEGRATIRWTSDGHTAQWVPLFAYGPGAERFGGVLDNTEIGRTVADLLELRPFLVARSKTTSVDRR